MSLLTVGFQTEIEIIHPRLLDSGVWEYTMYCLSSVFFLLGFWYSLVFFYKYLPKKQDELKFKMSQDKTRLPWKLIV